MKKIILAVIALTVVSSRLAAQGPNDTGEYYAEADGLSGSSLKTAMAGVINDHTELQYSDLWSCYYETDVRDDGYVWDMYSDATNYVLGDDQASGQSITAEGQVYNREHTMPKSWFGSATPMYTDLMHIVPTDGYVNAKRANYPFGETDSPTYSSANDFSLLGPSSIDGYSGTVFEPNDEYKGDFARIYFYMVTCYEDVVSGWSCDMLDGTAYPAFTDWALDMLLQWSEDDPVSQKELDRNEAVYKLQGNRNPYVDYEGLEQYVWGDKTDEAFQYATSTGITHTAATADGTTAVTVYSIAGAAVGTIQQGSTLSTDIVKQLPKGVYIISGRKVVVR